MESSIFTLALGHFYARVVLKMISVDQMSIYKVEKNATLYFKKKTYVE